MFSFSTSCLTREISFFSGLITFTFLPIHFKTKSTNVVCRILSTPNSKGIPRGRVQCCISVQQRRCNRGTGSVFRSFIKWLVEQGWWNKGTGSVFHSIIKWLLVSLCIVFLDDKEKVCKSDQFPKSLSFCTKF